MAKMGGILADAQITKGGPLILVQPENEYTGAVPGFGPFPNPYYMQDVEDQLRNAGIIVPLISNDASPDGHNVPGSGVGEVDIYVSAYDSTRRNISRPNAEKITGLRFVSHGV